MNLRVPAAGAAAFLLAAGVVVGAATPAYADPAEADLEVSLVGTTIAEGENKFASLIITNHGQDTATGVTVVYDLTALDTSKAQFPLADCPPPIDDVVECPIDGDLGAHAKFEFDDLLIAQPGETGDAGSITVSVSHDGTDPDEANNTTTSDVSIVAGGVDLQVFAPDVHQEVHVEVGDDFEVIDVEFPGTAILPGSDAVIEVFIANQGTEPTSGVEIAVTLPEHVTFLGPGGEVCTHESGEAATTCAFEDLAIAPGYPDSFDDECSVVDGTCSAVLFTILVQVAEDAPSPAALTDGIAEAMDMQLPILLSQSQSPPAMPGILLEPAPLDIDPSDNLSRFTVFVSDVPDDGGIGGGGELPKTGMPAVLIGGVGAGALVAGVVLFLLARRRKVVLESPTTLAG